MRDELTSLKNSLDSGKSCSNTSEVQDLKIQLLKMEADLERNKEDISNEINAEEYTQKQHNRFQHS